MIQNIAIVLIAGAKTSYAEGILKVHTETPRQCGPAETLQALRGVTIGGKSSSAIEYKCMPQVAIILLVVNVRS